jgi:hypothetical protein
MNLADPLPSDVESCHALIHQLILELAETRRKLSIHEQNERSRMEHQYGKGMTAQKLLAFGQKMNRPISDEDREATKRNWRPRTRCEDGDGRKSEKSAAFFTYPLALHRLVVVDGRRSCKTRRSHHCRMIQRS